MSSQPPVVNDQTDDRLGMELFNLIRGYIGSELLYVAAKLKLADYLADGVQSSAELAAQTQTHPAALQRVLLGLAGIGVCTHEGDTAFSLTPLGRLLTSDHPLGYQNVAIIHGEVLQRAVGEMLTSVQTGAVGIERALGASLFDYLAQHPEQGQRFDRFMGTVSGETARALLAGYDFSDATMVIDIGGGRGTIMAAILMQYPQMRGIVFDLPHVVERAEAYLRTNGLANRSETVAGDFFASVPAGGDIYLLSQILHDWDDAACGRILVSIRAAMTPQSRLLVLERVLPERVERGESSVVTDLLMLTVTGGQERTEQGYRRLLATAGFSQIQAIPLHSPFSVIEAMP